MAFSSPQEDKVYAYRHGAERLDYISRLDNAKIRRYVENYFGDWLIDVGTLVVTLRPVENGYKVILGADWATDELGVASDLKEAAAMAAGKAYAIAEDYEWEKGG